MGYKRKVTFQNQEVWGEEIEFETEKENWNTYILEDGTKLKMNSLFAKVLRLEVFKEDGEPIYLVNSSQIVTSDVPDNLKRKQP